MKRYSQEHQWIEVAADGASALVGITKYAADELGDITFIEMPAVGKTLSAGAQLYVIESVKAASDVFIPASGTISEVNTALETAPEKINEDPENAAWICRITNFNAAEIDALMDEAKYAEYCK
ncbi:MAG: glycine cleavage system protein GcvH [Victivallales bacterium]|nr:glycine cleavage system protein GcvH [Victivallales bacterium]